MQVRIAGLVPESFVDGSGIRFAIFMQGCLRRCEGCHNPNTHKLTDGNIADTEELLRRIESGRKILSGITLTGGEPLLQFDAALDLARGAKCTAGTPLPETSAVSLIKSYQVLISQPVPTTPANSLPDCNEGESLLRLINLYTFTQFIR